ncbi:MAG: CHASE2 domain-containing protein [Coleofasciculus sp. A1-SPW-01]|uniref:CHASE2 domain-containing protein n=1 Tax=Coleofasciculus sp. A1-SPW-01 TaxID=3070819 RepID=UPI0032FA46A8
MSKLAVLELRGDLNHQGFYVTLRIGQGDLASSITLDRTLPPSTLLSEHLTQWQQDYRRLSTPSRALKPSKIRVNGKIDPIEACSESAQRLEQQFQRWLRSDSFRDIDLQLRQALMPDELVQVLIRTANAEAQALPWHLWDFIEQYPKAEVALSSLGSSPCSGKRNSAASEPNQVNILAVLGDRTNIDVESDQQTLNELPGAKVEFLPEPTHQELHDKLYEKSWHILFFAGHSETQAKRQGILRLNSTTHLTIDQVRYGVQRAIANGLQLAIFNSCDGLGLAQALADLQLPHIIVMREVVPDCVAQQFLKYFLQEFSQGQSLHLAQREARQRLLGMEKVYPCASWLPVIFQPSAAKPLSWLDLIKPEDEGIFDQTVAVPTQKAQTFSLGVKLGTAFVCGALVSSVVVGIRALGWLQGWELKAFDHLIRVRPGQSIPDHRILVVAIGEEDIQYQRNQGMEMEGSLSDEALLALLQKFSPHQPSVIGLDIIHDFPFIPELQSHLKEQKLIAICQAKSFTSDLPGVKPPTSDFPVEQLGFNNVPLDRDGVIRRQFLGMPSDEYCPTQQSFGFRIAQNYLENSHGIKKEWITVSPHRNKRIQLGSQTFGRLEGHAGGYQLSQGDAGGYQVLVDYQAVRPKQVNLREILSGSLDSQLAGLVRDRIILIGVVNPNIDTHLTPYSKGLQAEAMPGVVVQAQMISQIISAALGERPLLSWWAEWAELLWIGSWAWVGAIVVVGGRSLYIQMVGVLISLILLWGVCLFLLVQGWWVPLVPSALALGITAVSVLGLYHLYSDE